MAPLGWAELPVKRSHRELRTAGRGASCRNNAHGLPEQVAIRGNGIRSSHLAAALHDGEVSGLLSALQFSAPMIAHGEFRAG